MMRLPAADLHPHVVTVVAFQTLSFLSAVFSVRYTQNITSYMKCGQNKKDLFSSFIIASFLCTNGIFTTIFNLHSFMPGCKHWMLHQTAHLVEYRSLHSPGNPGVRTQLQIEYLPVWRKPLCFLSIVPGLMED